MLIMYQPCSLEASYRQPSDKVLAKKNGKNLFKELAGESLKES